jgi:hypothetical protein
MALSRHPTKELLSLEEDANTLDAWQQFLDSNARAKDERLGYSFSTLRTILPESLGGYTVGGGGASSTLKRVLPLVARFFVRERGSEGG